MITVLLLPRLVDTHGKRKRIIVLEEEAKNGLRYDLTFVADIATWT